MRSHTALKLILLLVATGVIAVVIVLYVLISGIGASVAEHSATAQGTHPHPGDDIAALIAYMNSEEHTIEDRNHAVWTLGRFTSPRALPTLEAAYTGEVCRHGEALCQHELEKAIKRCGGIPDPPRQKKHEVADDAGEEDGP